MVWVLVGRKELRGKSWDTVGEERVGKGEVTGVIICTMGEYGVGWDGLVVKREDNNGEMTAAVGEAFVEEPLHGNGYKWKD